MNIQECIQFAKDHPTAYIATIDGDQPRVRIFLMWFADESGFYFIGLSPKKVSQQMHKNPKVEICFYNNPASLNDARQMRITGQLEFLCDDATLEKAYEARSFLENIVGRSIKPYIEPFRIASGEAHFWTMADVMREHQLERISF